MPGAERAFCPPGDGKRRNGTGLREVVVSNAERKEGKGTNKAELVGKIADHTGLTKKSAEKAVNAFVSTVQGALKSGGKVSLVGFGTFEVRHRSARKGRNPQTGQVISIKASKVPAFKAGKALKETVGGR